MSNTKKAVALIGYTDRLSARPGETIAFKVSSELEQPFKARLSRSISADPNPDGLGILEHAMDDFFSEQTFESRKQSFISGSYAISQSPVQLDQNNSFSASVRIWPTLHKQTAQSILAWGDLHIFLNEKGMVSCSLGTQTLFTNTALTLRQWYQINVSFDHATKCIRLQQSQLVGTHELDSEELNCNVGFDQKISAPVYIAACKKDGVAANHFNGKIESPKIYGSSNINSSNITDSNTTDSNTTDWPLIAGWNFAENMASMTVPDETANANHLHLQNAPARAMTSSAWDGSEMCWRHKHEHYQAIHFHDDDIYDFGWDTDFTFTIPPGMPSGVYIMRIQSGEHEDAMPFYVCPPKGTSTAKLCVLIPTFTYAVYGNHARPDYVEAWQNKNKQWGAYPHNPAEYSQYGLSTYNFHSDGSGICHASHKRPLFNMRPGYITFGSATCSGLRHFQADSHLISWLHEKSIDYDIVTDQQLHDEGVSVLQHYAAITTTTHPEYHTPESWNALLAYRNNGGHLAYLGGNGFYWRIATHAESENLLEIRRGEDGIRAWAAEPGEYYHGFDGAYGGLWRRNGKPPQQLVGVGFSAQGQFNGSYYRRVCHDEKFEWVFDGIEGEIIGDFGFSGHGAAGFELDRMDFSLGSPNNCILLASSENHSDDFILVPEEMLTHLTNVPGEAEDTLLRADIVYFEVPGGGSVFTTGSITFCGSLPYNRFDNNVSKLLQNVLHHMEAI